MLETLDDYKRDLEASLATQASLSAFKKQYGARCEALLPRSAEESRSKANSEVRFSLGKRIAPLALFHDPSNSARFLLSDAVLLEEFKQLARFERVVTDDENHAALALHHSVIAERVLRDGLLDRSEPISRPILESCEETGPRSLLEGYYGKRLKPTLGVVELFGMGLRRCLERKHRGVCEWVDAGFEAELPQGSGGVPRLVRGCLADREFGLFLANLRERIRNPVAHGRHHAHVPASEYRAYCRGAYGHSSLHDWVKAGISKIGTEGSAWIAMITITAKTIEPSSYSRLLRAIKFW